MRDSKGRFIKGGISPKKGKTIEEIYGNKEAKLIKDRMRDSHLGKKLSLETKEKLSAIHKNIENSGRFKKGHKVSEKRISQLRESSSQCGENHPAWKGGKYVRKDGRVYFRINKKDIPRAHINWMEANQMYIIPDGCVIHHRDLNKSNDNPENLALLSDGIHRSLHAKLRFNKIKLTEVEI